MYRSLNWNSANFITVTLSINSNNTHERFHCWEYCLLHKYWNSISENSPTKNSLCLVGSNLIGHTNFLTGEKYRMTNQKPDTILFTSERIRIGFSRLSGRSCGVIESECLQRSLLSENLQTLIQWSNLSRTKKTKVQEIKLNKMLLYLRNFWRWERFKTYRKSYPEGAECIRRWIYHYGSKERQQRRLLTQLLTLCTWGSEPP